MTYPNPKLAGIMTRFEKGDLVETLVEYTVMAGVVEHVGLHPAANDHRDRGVWIRLNRCDAKVWSGELVVVPFADLEDAPDLVQHVEPEIVR